MTGTNVGAMKAAKSTVILALLLMMISGCRLLDGEQGGEVSIVLDTPFTLGNGQSARLQGAELKITFDAVKGDGRCPSEVNCVEQGAVEIVVLTQLADETAVRHEMNPDPALAQFGWAPAAVAVGEYMLELQAVQPYPEQPEDLETFDDYEATFLLSARAGE